MADDYGPGDHVMVTVDPARNGGTPSLSRRMVPLDAVVGKLLAGDDPAKVAYDYDLTEAEGRVAAALAEVVGDLSPGPLREWQCPACGATTRARMADHTRGGQ